MLRRSVPAWLAAHERAILAWLLAAGVGLRVLLVTFSPRPFGYVWDFYDDGVRILYERGRLPVAGDCWQCYHPPLFYLLGWPFYAFGRWMAPGPDDATALRWLGALPLICGAVTIYFGYRLLRLFRCRGASLVLGVALLITFPCLFISSYGADADIVITAILSALIYYLTRDVALAGRPGSIAALRLGVLSGLAAATKYSGLLGVASDVAVFGIRTLCGPRRALAVRSSLIVIAACVVLGGWKYFDNMEWYGAPFHANGTAAVGLSLDGPPSAGMKYEFTTLRLRDLMALAGPNAPAGRLTDLAIYPSVITTLHALAWSDMTIFSEPSRHGDPSHPYPAKRVPPIVMRAVLLLGFVPEVLAIVGLAVTLRRRRLWPVGIVCGLSAAAYLGWFLTQPLWGLKTKYILFLLLPFVLYVVIGFAWIWRRAPPAVGAAAAVLLAALILATHVYLLAFSIG